MEPQKYLQDTVSDCPIDKKTDYRNARSNKKDNAKALQVLGIDPSLNKLEDSLGIEEEEIRNFIAQSQFDYCQTPSTSYFIDKKKNKKACEVLGYDPSLFKIMSYFGFELEEQVLNALEESSPNTLLYVPTFERVVSKKDSQKACKVLGYDPSLSKLMKMIGLDPYIVNRQTDELIAENVISIM